MAQKIETQCSALAASFAFRLRQWRRLRRIPLKQLAADLGVSMSVISAWEKEKRFPTLKHLETVSRHTGIPTCQFLYRDLGNCPHCRED